MPSPSRRARLALELDVSVAADAGALDRMLPSHLQNLVGCGPVFLGAVDPTTLNFTRSARVDIADDVATEFLAHEIEIDDVVKLRDLAQARDPFGSLLGATGGDPRTSARWRDVIEPLGWGDELRVALREGARTWGFLCLHRMAAEQPFSAADVAAVRAAAPVIATALRRTSLTTSGVEADDSGARPGPGVVVIDPDMVVRSMTGAAEHWLESLGGDAVGGVPTLIMAATARAVATTRPVVVRTMTIGGNWLTVQASPLLGGQPRCVAVVLTPSAPTDVLASVAAAVGLTGRERDVVDAVLRGLSTRIIARTLDISEHTVQDHLKSIYTKFGVRSRGEVVALLLAG